MSYRFTVTISQEEDWFVAKCVDNGVASQGKTIDESLKNLSEAVALYYEDNKEKIGPSQVFVTTMEIAI